MGGWHVPLSVWSFLMTHLAHVLSANASLQSLEVRFTAGNLAYYTCASELSWMFKW